MTGSIMAGDIVFGLSDCWPQEVLSLYLLLLAFFASGKYAKYVTVGQKDSVWDLLDFFNDAIEDGLRGLYSSSNFFTSANGADDNNLENGTKNIDWQNPDNKQYSSSDSRLEGVARGWHSANGTDDWADYGDDNEYTI
ncbi:uncharacterized protein PAC_04192 [Phialocephala subalpina]|uniref:Uncharacterized protein n=1 Tax=Phialocephala subalpina TaxID=576137 RepID=A0A1L7WNG5_9HELO|nr:uncharacterized protein PAC_04192 [Phialocephala subalpina]